MFAGLPFLVPEELLFFELGLKIFAITFCFVLEVAVDSGVLSLYEVSFVVVAFAGFVVVIFTFVVVTF